MAKDDDETDQEFNEKLYLRGMADQMEKEYQAASSLCGEDPEDIEWFRHYVWAVLASIIHRT